MTRKEAVSTCNNLLANNEVLKVINFLLNYLKNSDSHLERKLGELKNKFIALEEQKIEKPESEYYQKLEKIKNTLYLYLNDIPESGSKENIETKFNEKSQAVPDSMWAFIWNILTNWKILVITLSSIFAIYLLIRLTGRDPLCLLFKDCSEFITKEKTDDPFLNSAILAGKDYMIDDLTMIVDYENLEDKHTASWTTIYQITALKQLDSVSFPEQYFSSYVDSIEHVFGNNLEEMKGDGRSYNIFLNLKKGERKTIITGSIFKYNLPLKSNRFVSRNDEELKINEEGYMYNNQDGGDFIKQLTILINSNTLAIKPTYKGARKYSKNSNIEKDFPFYNFDIQSSRIKNKSISYTWKNITPKDNVAIYFKWE